MSETSASLLDRARDRGDAEAWQQLVELYTPLIRGWLRRHAGLLQEADDVVQDVLSVVARKVGQFEREPRKGAFRKWLRTITVRCLSDHWKSRRGEPRARASGHPDLDALLDQFQDPNGDLARQWDREHDHHVTHRLLDLIRDDFEPRTWTAFERLTLRGEPADEVARALGMSTNAVFIAKSRVLSRLRQEGKGLLDDD